MIIEYQLLEGNITSLEIDKAKHYGTCFLSSLCSWGQWLNINLAWKRQDSLSSKDSIRFLIVSRCWIKRMYSDYDYRQYFLYTSSCQVGQISELRIDPRVVKMGSNVSQMDFKPEEISIVRFMKLGTPPALE